jgi:hypothetical protein
MHPRESRPVSARRFLATVLVAAAIVMGVACRSASFAPQYANLVTDAAPEPELLDASSCAGCVANLCAIERARCAANVWCAQALADGGNGTNNSDAARDQLEGRAAYDTLRACEVRAARTCTACTNGEPVYTDPLLTQACQDAGVRDNDGGGLPACDKCLDLKCCESSAKYFSFDERFAYRDCVDPCFVLPVREQQACKQGCYAIYPRPLVEGNLERLSCAILRCPAECKAQDPCRSCLRLNCANETAACLGNVECDLLSVCYGGCGNDTQCVTACQLQFPTARARFARYAGCATAHCSVCNE